MDSGKKYMARWGYLAASIIVFIIELIIALYVHDRIIRPYIGDMLVVVLVYCFVRVFVPRGMKRLPLYVFLFAAVSYTHLDVYKRQLLNCFHNSFYFNKFSVINN